jgi:uncharacterized protein DUF6587
MNAVVDNSLVAAALLVSLVYALFKLGPRTLRQRILWHSSRVLASAPSFLRLAGVAQRLAVASGKTQAACGGCDTCGESAPQASSDSKSSSEVNVPIANIGRRT